MHETRTIPDEIQRRYTKGRLATIVTPLIIGAPSFGLIWINGHNGSRPWLWVGIAGFVGSVIFAVISQEWRNRHFKCPNCERAIPVRYANVPQYTKKCRIEFVCSHCKITWDTGLFT